MVVKVQLRAFRCSGLGRRGFCGDHILLPTVPPE